MMKIKYSVVAVLLAVNVSSALAEDVPSDYDPAVPRPEEVNTLRDPNAYQWLYNLVLPSRLRASQPNQSFKSFSVHLQDSYSKFPHPDAIMGSALRGPGLYSGKITYVDFWPMAYQFNALQGKSSKQRMIRVNIHFKNASAADLQRFADRIKVAESIWNNSRPKLDFAYGFRFQVVTDPRQAHYSVNIKDSTRGPYSENWGRSWSSNTIAHEIGHMMGLGDEYETVSGKMNCLYSSLMCNDHSGDPMLHHYYFVLRRLVR